MDRLERALGPKVKKSYVISESMRVKSHFPAFKLHGIIAEHFPHLRNIEYDDNTGDITKVDRATLLNIGFLRLINHGNGNGSPYKFKEYLFGSPGQQLIFNVLITELSQATF